MGRASMVNVGGVTVGGPMILVMGGLGLEGAQGKECCRYQQSHTQVPLQLLLSGRPAGGVVLECRAVLCGFGGTSIAGGKFPHP